MKKLCIVAVLIIMLVGYASSQEGDYTYVKVAIGKDFRQYDQIIKQYGDLWIGYIPTGMTYITYIGEKKYVISSAVLCYKRNGEYIVMGTYNGDGTILDVDDKNIPQAKFSTKVTVVGISSDLLIDPFAPCYVVKDRDSGKLRQIDPIADLEIDFAHDTIRQYNYGE